VDRAPGVSVRLKLTLSYAGFLMLAGVLLLAAVWMFLLRGTPVRYLVPDLTKIPHVFQPGNFGAAVFGPAAVVVMAFLLVFGLVGGWILAGRMLAPLTRITAATRLAATGSLTHRIRLPGRSDETRPAGRPLRTAASRTGIPVACRAGR
jgi:two-component system, OmpR family, sensor histidine kinase VanS